MRKKKPEYRCSGTIVFKEGDKKNGYIVFDLDEAVEMVDCNRGLEWVKIGGSVKSIEKLEAVLGECAGDVSVGEIFLSEKDSFQAGLRYRFDDGRWVKEVGRMLYADDILTEKEWSFLEGRLEELSGEKEFSRKASYLKNKFSRLLAGLTAEEIKEEEKEAV